MPTWQTLESLTRVKIQECPSSNTAPLDTENCASLHRFGHERSQMASPERPADRAQAMRNIKLDFEDTCAHDPPARRASFGMPFDKQSSTQME